MSILFLLTVLSVAVVCRHRLAHVRARAHRHTHREQLCARVQGRAGAWSFEPPATGPTWREKVISFNVTNSCFGLSALYALLCFAY